MTPPTIVALGCALLSEHTEIGFDHEGFVERVTIELGGNHDCLGVDLLLPDGIELTSVEGRVRPVDDRPYRVGPTRLERIVNLPDGTRTWRLHLPALADGDTAEVTIARTWVRPVDLVWRPGLDRPGFAELELPKGFTLRASSGVKKERTVLWVDRPGADASAVIAHPWAPHTPAALPSMSTDTLSADEALATIATLRLVDAAWFGPAPVVGRDALSLGTADRRGIARTLVALASRGPDHVEVGRWAPDATTEPDSDATEAAIRWTASGPELLLHPDDDRFPTTGVLVAPGGVVALSDARTVRCAPVPATPAELPAVETHVAVDVSGRDPLKHLHPDGDRVVRAEQRLSWSTPLAAPWVGWFPLPRHAIDVTQAVSPDCAHLRATHDAVWVIAAPGSRSCTFTVAMPLDDAWGPLPRAAVAGAVFTTTGHATWTPPKGGTVPGELALEDDTWRLVSLAGHRLLDGPATLEHELVDRFHAAAMPEPGLSRALRGHRSGWALAGAVHELLAERVLVRPLDLRPDRPRPLVRAREGRVVTPGEAAMIASLWLQQAGIDATWVLARPRTLGPRVALAPVGFDAGLVRVDHEGRIAWIDVGCELCGPFEVRPELVGADAIGPGPDHVGALPLHDGVPVGIALRDGLWVATEPLVSGVGVSRSELGQVDADGLAALTWYVAGADALALRRWLADVAPDKRAIRLRARLGAPAAAPLTIDGLAEPGAPVTITTRVEPARVPDALVAPLAGTPPPGGGWLGLRERRRPVTDAVASDAPATDAPATDAPASDDPGCRTTIVGDTLVEQVLIVTP